MSKKSNTILVANIAVGQWPKLKAEEYVKKISKKIKKTTGLKVIAFADRGSESSHIYTIIV